MQLALSNKDGTMIALKKGVHQSLTYLNGYYTMYPKGPLGSLK